MIPLLRNTSQQKPLFHIIHEDDRYLLNTDDAEWFQVLYHFRYERYVGFGVDYYNALHEFNQKQAREREERGVEGEKDARETKEEARQRLLFSRVTMQAEGERGEGVLFEVKREDLSLSGVSPESIAPGKVPFRFGGKKPKCFFALLKSFIGATIMGFPAEPEKVYRLLKSNPSFARVCGFIPRHVRDEYCSEHIPSLRKLEQFDQIMRESGIWARIKVEEVKANITSGIIRKENELVGDTTHYYAYSGFETVVYKDASGKEQKKSQSKVTKRCGCEDKQGCSHSWGLSDDGAGTIVKSGGKMYWGHKASVLGYPRQGIPLDARAIKDAATFDGMTLYPHVKEVFEMYPEIQPSVERVLYDSAGDSDEIKKKFREDLGIEVKVSFNPRRKKEITEDLPRGIDKITPYGIPVCKAGYEMEYQGMRYEHEKFIYQAPKDSDNAPVCRACYHREDCCPNATGGRIINISFGLLPHIDPKDPPMAKRYKAIMSRRPAVERMIKRLKCDFGDDRLTKRGNDSFQAYLDKTMIAFHVLLRN
ncbi:MAG: transposase [Candidatus Brocadia sp.]|nr:MAG: transposase [Candidatus Brocadia sp.]UJS20956.1 MAG: transposase [Candidatus Brocadia sp.]